MTQEEIDKAVQEYQDSLCLPEWDRKEIHGIDFRKGIEYALAYQFIHEKK